MKSEAAWKEYCRTSRKKPSDIPTDPAGHYGQRFKGMAHWLGIGEQRTRRRRWRTYEQSLVYAHSLGLKTVADWKKWCKDGKRPADIPAAPEQVYVDEWKGYTHWLHKWRSLKESAAYVRTQSVKTKAAWDQWRKSKKRPKDIPVGRCCGC